MKHPVEAPLRADVEHPIRQDRHDLARWQRRKFRLVAGQQDPLALIIGKPVRHQTWTPFTAIQSVPYTGELLPPALQRGEPHAKQSGECTGPCTGSHRRIEDLQGLAAIGRRCQSPASSPQ